MGWPFVAFAAVLVAGYCFCKYLDKLFPSQGCVDPEDDAEEVDEDEEDEEDQDDETS